MPFLRGGRREAEPPRQNFLIHLGVNLEFLMLFLRGGAGGQSCLQNFFEPFRY